MRSSRQWIDKNFDGVYLADSLASLGYLVMVTDALYWGERSSEDAHRWSELTYGTSNKDKAVKDTIKVLKSRVYDGQEDLYWKLHSQNIIWAEKMLRDDVASVRLLKSLPFVDKDRIGAFGFSMGAHRCWMLAAFCKDVRCGVALSWMTTLDRDERMKASDYSMAVMPMREQMDFCDIGRYLAPKHMLFLSGTTDHLFPKEKVAVAFEKLHGYYDDCPENLETRFFDGGHHCGKEVQSVIFDYFDDNL
jgi:dienelactone hydrolase